MFEKFIDQITQQGNLNDSDIDYLREHARVKFYRKNETIIQAGKIVRNVYFVLDGCVRLFYNVDGKDKTAFFYQKDNFIWANKSLSNQVPTQKNFDAVEDTILVQIDKQAIYELAEKSPRFEQITRLGKEKELIAYQQQIAFFVTLSPEERFIKLFETNRGLFQQVPQQYIASYLGVSAETLSRIKKRVYEKHKDVLYC